MRLGKIPFILFISCVLSACSGGSVLDYVGLGDSSITTHINPVEISSTTVQDFATTCVQNAGNYNQMKQAARKGGWQPVSRAYLLLNGFRTISARRDLLNKRGSQVQALKKVSNSTASILLFYQMNYRKQSQVKCEIYVNGEPRDRVYTALNSLINHTPLRNKKTENSHLSVWKLRQKGTPFTVRYLYEFNEDDLLDFNGVKMWTHYS